jgi:hypothetical protein
VVAPAFAAAIEGGMMFAPVLAASRKAARADLTATSSRAARQASKPGDLVGLGFRVGHHDGVGPGGQGRGLALSR